MFDLLYHSALYNINGSKGVATYFLQTLSVYDVTLTSRSTVFLKKLMFIHLVKKLPRLMRRPVSSRVLGLGSYPEPDKLSPYSDILFY